MNTTTNQPTVLIRIEHPTSGKGMFNHLFYCENRELLQEFFERHRNLPCPYEHYETIEMREAFGYSGNGFYCSYKSNVQMSEWVNMNEFEYIINAGFKIYAITIEDCIIGNYQAIYKKENIIKQEDITSMYLK